MQNILTAETYKPPTPNRRRFEIRAIKNLILDTDLPRNVPI